MNKKLKDSLWKTQDILQVIPHIENILKRKFINKDSVYRSLSQPFCVPYTSIPLKTRKKRPRNKPELFSPKLNRTFEGPSQAPNPNQISNQQKIILLPKDDTFQYKVKNNETLYTKKRKEIKIPIIKLEKSLPKNYRTRSVIINRLENFSKPDSSEKQSCEVVKVEYPRTLVYQGTRLKKNVYERNAKTAMKDEAVGLDLLNSQSSGIFSEGTLMTYFMPMFSPDPIPEVRDFNNKF